MEFEISDEPGGPAGDHGDSDTIKETIPTRDRPAIPSENLPDPEDRALHIPEEGD